MEQVEDTPEEASDGDEGHEEGTYSSSPAR